MIARSTLAFQKGVSEARINGNSFYQFNNKRAMPCLELEGCCWCTLGSGTRAQRQYAVWERGAKAKRKMKVTFLP